MSELRLNHVFSEQIGVLLINNIFQMNFGQSCKTHTVRTRVQTYDAHLRNHGGTHG